MSQRMTSEDRKFFVVLISSSGIPSFTFSYGQDSLPFAAIGTLFGIHSFCKTNLSDLKKTSGKRCQIIWKSFDEDILVIASSVKANPSRKSLDLFYSALLLYVGNEVMLKSKSQELLRKDLKASTFLVNWIVKGIAEDEGREILVDATLAADCMVPLDQAQLQQHVSNFSTSIQSFYVSLLVSYRVAASTSDWWSLTGVEMALIVGCLRVEKEANVKDMQIFLHNKSPNMPVRLVWCRISLNCLLVALCGPRPSTDVFVETAKRTFQPALIHLRNAESTYPYNVPPSTILDTVILGYLVTDRETSRCLSSICPHRQPVRFPFPVQNILLPQKRMKILRDAARTLQAVDEAEAHYESFKRYGDYLSYYLRTTRNFAIFLFPVETPVHLARATSIKTTKIIDDLLSRT